MYKINSTEIQNDVLAANVTIIQDDSTELVVTVPVKTPKNKASVIAAIEYREGLERAKYNAAPVLTAIKGEIDLTIGQIVTVKK
jgi:hypothetical protein